MALFTKTKKEDKKPVAKKTAVPASLPADTSVSKEKKKGETSEYTAVLRRPSITEKSLRATEKNVYVFLVDPRTTKREVAKAVKAIYGFTAQKVNIVRVAARATVSRTRRKKGVASGYKKAYVFLKKGEKIELT